MGEANNVQSNGIPPLTKNTQRVIDETNYKQYAPAEAEPNAVGSGGDPLFIKTKASSAELYKLLEETTTVQDWGQREASNQVALSCLEEEGLKDIYFQIKDGFKDYGRVLLMGFKTPQGVGVPRLKIYNPEGEVVEVLTGAMAIAEIKKRGEEFQS